MPKLQGSREKCDAAYCSTSKTRKFSPFGSWTSETIKYIAKFFRIHLFFCFFVHSVIGSTSSVVLLRSSMLVDASCVPFVGWNATDVAGSECSSNTV